MRVLGAIGLMICLAMVFLTEDETVETRQARHKAFLAAQRGDVRLLSAALASGIDPNLYTEDRGSLLSAAASSGIPEAVALLIESGADVDFAPDGNMTPLIAALIGDKCEPAVVLLQAGADVDARLQHYERYAFGVEYKNISARELYYLNKAKWHWERESCWLRVEKLMRKPLTRTDELKRFWKSIRRKVFEALAALPTSTRTSWQTNRMLVQTPGSSSAIISS